MEERNKNSIDYAIDDCKDKVNIHRAHSRSILIGIVLFLVMILSMTFMLTYKYFGLANISINAPILYILSAIIIMIFGVFMSIYRFHLKEVAKYEHLHVGFLRIRVAGNNTKTGYQSEVRKSLTENAFNFDISISGDSTTSKVKNPLPGHPTSDISTLLINKLLDNIEFKQKENKKLNLTESHSTLGDSARCVD